MKKILIAMLACGAMALSLTACGGAQPEAPAASETTAESSAAETSSEATESKDPVAPAEISVTVDFGDYDAQQALSKSIQNGEMTGQGIEIDGISSKGISHYSIGQEDGKGNYVGTTYEMEGEYPEDGAHVKLTGTVVGQFPMFYIQADSVVVAD